MSTLRKKTVDDYSADLLLQMVKQSLDDLGISYEEAPGGFGQTPLLDPQVFDLVDYSEYTIKKAPFRRFTYRPRNHVKYSYAMLSSDISGDDDHLYLAS